MQPSRRVLHPYILVCCSTSSCQNKRLRSATLRQKYELPQLSATGRLCTRQPALSNSRPEQDNSLLLLQVGHEQLRNWVWNWLAHFQRACFWNQQEQERSTSYSMSPWVQEHLPSGQECYLDATIRSNTWLDTTFSLFASLGNDTVLDKSMRDRSAASRRITCTTYPS